MIARYMSLVQCVGSHSAGVRLELSDRNIFQRLRVRMDDESNIVDNMRATNEEWIISAISNVLALLEGVLRGRTNSGDLLGPLKDVYAAAKEKMDTSWPQGALHKDDDYTMRQLLQAAVSLHNKVRVMSTSSSDFALPRAYMMCASAMLVWVSGELHASGRALALNLLINGALAMVDVTAHSEGGGELDVANTCLQAVLRIWSGSGDVRTLMESLGETEYAELCRMVFKVALTQSELLATSAARHWTDIHGVLEIALDLYQTSRISCEGADLVNCLLRVGTALESNASPDAIHSFELALKVLGASTQALRDADGGMLLNKAHLGMAFSHLRMGDKSQARAHLRAMETGGTEGRPDVLLAKLSALCSMNAAGEALVTLQEYLRTTDDHSFVLGALNHYENCFPAQSSEANAQVEELYHELLNKYTAGEAHVACVLAYLTSRLTRATTTDFNLNCAPPELLQSVLCNHASGTSVLNKSSLTRLVALSLTALRLCRAHCDWTNALLWATFLGDVQSAGGEVLASGLVSSTDVGEGGTLTDPSFDWSSLKCMIRVWEAEAHCQLGHHDMAYRLSRDLLHTTFNPGALVVFFNSARRIMGAAVVIDAVMDLMRAYEKAGGSREENLELLLVCHTEIQHDSGSKLLRHLLEGWLDLYLKDSKWKLALLPGDDKDSIRAPSTVVLGVFNTFVRACLTQLEEQKNQQQQQHWDSFMECLRDLVKITKQFEGMLRECLSSNRADVPLVHGDSSNAAPAPAPAPNADPDHESGPEKLHLVFGDPDSFTAGGMLLSYVGFTLAPLVLKCATSDSTIALAASHFLEAAEYFFWCGASQQGRGALADCNRMGALTIAASLRMAAYEDTPRDKRDPGVVQRALVDCTTALDLLEILVGRAGSGEGEGASILNPPDVQWFPPEVGSPPYTVLSVCLEVLMCFASSEDRALYALVQERRSLFSVLSSSELLLIATLLKQQRVSLASLALEVVDLGLSICRVEQPRHASALGQLHRLGVVLSHTKKLALERTCAFADDLNDAELRAACEESDTEAIFAMAYNKSLACAEMGNYHDAEKFLLAAERILPQVASASHEIRQNVQQMLATAVKNNERK